MPLQSVQSTSRCDMCGSYGPQPLGGGRSGQQRDDTPRGQSCGSRKAGSFWPACGGGMLRDPPRKNPNVCVGRSQRKMTWIGAPPRQASALLQGDEGSLCRIKVRRGDHSFSVCREQPLLFVSSTLPYSPPLCILYAPFPCTAPTARRHSPSLSASRTIPTAQSSVPASARTALAQAMRPGGHLEGVEQTKARVRALLAHRTGYTLDSSESTRP